MVTVPPAGVNLRALSARVFTMNSVSTRSAFTSAVVGTTLSVMPFSVKPIWLLPTMLNRSFRGKVSMCRLTSPCRN